MVNSYNYNYMVDCPRGTNGLYPYPFDQNKYLSCMNGLLLLEACSPGSAFSLSQKRCESKEDLKSNDRVQYYAEFEEWNNMEGKIYNYIIKIFQ